VVVVMRMVMSLTVVVVVVVIVVVIVRVTGVVMVPVMDVPVGHVLSYRGARQGPTRWGFLRPVGVSHVGRGARSRAGRRRHRYIDVVGFCCGGV
jgi:hypothetical protein